MLDYLNENRKIDKPKVSIITVTYNNRSGLIKTLDSIKKQSYPYIESIIVDGGSTDGSIEEIKKFEKEFSDVDKIRTCKWMSENDRGLYYALNKGMKMFTGDIVGCLWDEFYSSDALNKLISKMTEENADGVHGDLIYAKDDRIIRKWIMGKGRITDGWIPAHPTLYLKSEIIRNTGLYNTELVSASDFEYMVRVLKNETYKLAYVSDYVVKMSYGGMTTNSKIAYLRSIVEGCKALRMNGVKHPIIITLKRCVKTAGQFKK